MSTFVLSTGPDNGGISRSLLSASGFGGRNLGASRNDQGTAGQ
jgi:hypothetical protein